MKDKYYYKDGSILDSQDYSKTLHRTNDKPAIEFANGTKYWYIDNELHRANDKPAVEFANGDKYWYIDGKLHRTNDKPAVEWASGDKWWYIDGKEYTYKEYKAILKEVENMHKCLKLTDPREWVRRVG